MSEQTQTLSALRAGPFDQIDLSGRDLVIEQRRLLPATVCFVIGLAAATWVAAGWQYPKWEYVPEPDQFRPLLIIAGAFGLVGFTLLAWRTVHVLSPATREWRTSRGFPGLSHSKVQSVESLSLSIHPIDIEVRSKGLKAAWRGTAVVLNIGQNGRILCAATAAAEDALQRAREVCDTCGIEFDASRTDKLTAAV